MNIEEKNNMIEKIIEKFYESFAEEDIIENLQKNNYSENRTYFSEYPSILIFLSYLYGKDYTFTTIENLDMQIERYAGFLVNSIKANRNNNASFCYGLTGIAYAFDYCLKKTGKFENIVNVIEDRLLFFMDIELANIRKKKYQHLKESEYDLITGLSGAANYFLLKKEIKNKEQIEKVLDYFSELFYSEDKIVNVLIKPDEMVMDYLREQYPKGYINLGVSHGILGPMNALCQGYLKFNNKKYKIALKRGISIYSNNIKKSYDIIKKKMVYGWPGRLEIENKKYKYSENQSWCYGSLGMARVLYQIAVCLNEDNLKTICMKVVNSSIGYNISNDLMRSNAICHGLAGKLMMLDRMYQDVKLEYLRDESEKYFMEIIKSADLNSKYIFKEFDIYFRGKMYDKGYEYIDLGILSGNTGIIMTLLGHLNGDFEPLCKMFLV